MTRFAPLPGDPGSIRVIAEALTASAHRFGATGQALGGLGGGAVWDGPAGEAFAARIGALPAVLDAAASRYAACSATLHVLADSLAEAQRTTAVASETDIRCAREYERLEERATELAGAGRGEADPETIAIRAAQQRLMGERMEARAAHRQAVADHAGVDRECAARLGRAADDAIADSRGYRLLRAGSASSRLSEGLELPGMLLPPLGALTGVLNAGSETLLRLFYDEGSWRDVAVNGVLATAAGWGRILRRGAALGAEITTSTASGRSVRRGVTRTEYTLGARLRVAGREEVTTRVRARLSSFVDPTIRGLPGSGAVPSRGTPTALAGPPPPAGAGVLGRGASLPLRMKSVAMEQLNTRFLDSWRLASAGGPTTRRMYVAGITLEGAAKGASPVVTQGDATSPTAPAVSPPPASRVGAPP